MWHKQTVWLGKALLIVLLVVIPGYGAVADRYLEMRTQVGLKIFKLLLAADLQLDSKLDSQGRVDIAMLYADDIHYAESIVESDATNINDVQNHPAELSVKSLDQLLNSDAGKPSAVFVTQKLEAEELQRLVQYSIAKGLIVFSPFAGDVEQGILGGVAVEARVRPSLNLNTLSQSKVSIKSFFIKVARKYE